MQNNGIVDEYGRPFIAAPKYSVTLRAGLWLAQKPHRMRVAKTTSHVTFWLLVAALTFDVIPLADHWLGVMGTVVALFSDRLMAWFTLG